MSASLGLCSRGLDIHQASIGAEASYCRQACSKIRRSRTPMNLTNVAIRQLQDAPFPDFVTRPAIDSLVTEARKRLDRDGPHDEAAFAREMEIGRAHV